MIQFNTILMAIDTVTNYFVPKKYNICIVDFVNNKRS